MKSYLDSVLEKSEVNYVADKSRTIYLIAAMRGYQWYNYPLLDRTAKNLRSIGWNVISPADEDRKRGFDAMALPGDFDWSQWPAGLSRLDTISDCVSSLINDAGAVYVLTPEDKLGPGGKAELAVARWLGLKVFDLVKGDKPQSLLEPIRLLGICGRAGSGKDLMRSFVAGEINRSWGEPYGADLYSFADPMRDIACGVFGFTKGQLLNRELKEKKDEFWDITPRRFLQILGTDMFREHFRDDVWLKVADLHLSKLCAGIVTIIADVRFDNEAEWIKKNNGIVLKINRPGFDTPPQHASENGVSPNLVDYTFDNSGSVDDMKRFAIGLAGLMKLGEMRVAKNDL